MTKAEYQEVVPKNKLLKSKQQQVKERKSQQLQQKIMAEKRENEKQKEKQIQKSKSTKAKLKKEKTYGTNVTATKAEVMNMRLKTISTVMWAVVIAAMLILMNGKVLAGKREINWTEIKLLANFCLLKKPKKN